MSDRRDPDLITYNKETLIWVGLIMLITKLGARRKITNHMREENFYVNAKALCGH
ncbi:MAG: hypothetical protein HQL23_02025 [Candidatus Omnitrophica bacterium]|nr:hypothetical protein [Candidatus Omnitrophota bacterium]